MTKGHPLRRKKGLCYKFQFLVAKISRYRSSSPEMFLGKSTLFFLYKHEGKFTPPSIMLSFLRISASNYAYDMLNISFLRKF